MLTKQNLIKCDQAHFSLGSIVSPYSFFRVVFLEKWLCCVTVFLYKHAVEFECVKRKKVFLGIGLKNKNNYKMRLATSSKAGYTCRCDLGWSLAPNTW